MGTIETSIVMNDYVSNTIAGILRTVDMAIRSFEMADAATNKMAEAAVRSAHDYDLVTQSIDNTAAALEAVESAAGAVELNNLVADTAQAAQNVNDLANNAQKTVGLNQRMAEMFQRVKGGINESARAQSQLNDQIRRGEQDANNLIGTVKRLAVTLGSIYTLKQSLALSDYIVGSNVRLGLINDGNQSVRELQDMIYNSANSARAGYSQTIEYVFDLGINAGNQFETNSEMIGFIEILSKQFDLAEASASEADMAMRTLTQAMANGQLQGEFKSIAKNAPLLANALEESLGVSREQLKEMATEGRITAEMIKSAVFSIEDSLNAQLANNPKKWSDYWKTFKNDALHSFQRVSSQLSYLANTDAIKKMVQTTTDMVDRLLNQIAHGIQNITAIAETLSQKAGFDQFISDVTAGISLVTELVLISFDLIGRGAMWVADNWEWLRYVVFGVAGAFLVYKTAALGVWAVQKTLAIGTTMLTILKSIDTTVTYALATAEEREAMAAGIAALSNLLLAGSIYLILGAIILIIAIIYAVVYAFNKWTDSTVSATGIIAGAINVMVTAITNNIKYLYNIFQSFAEFFENVFKHPVYSVQRLFVNLFLNIFDYILSFDPTGMLQKTFGGMRDMIENNMNTMMPDDYIVRTRAEYANVADSYNSGYAWGQGAEESLMMAMDGQMLALNAEEQVSLLNNINKNTASSANSLKLDDNTHAKLREFAKNEFVNRFTTAEIVIQMENNNTFNNQTDVDGFMSALTAAVKESVDTTKEGV
ncbi:tape measure protein [Methanolapillus millepedarum]|uniref:Tape measure protein N-terminal domain-containing protein n=1 Tax=Methanolapillus millepedarum TaxID=3028296 RepID=A0AA96V4R5_9EURY|nr:hypothetical protein MsAc7_17610 [Methanosarcinaceae archaeon Ac7]